MQIDYKETLNLPTTDFPMKANLTQRELEILKFWDNVDVYKKILQKNKDARSYILHDGPPYANGNIHIGHALNKILKDFIVKFYSLKGYYSPYVPGWDCHGLPIELQVDKNLGTKKDTIDVLAKRLLCREYATKYLSIQREEFKRLGVFGDWTNPYITMSYEYEASIVSEFIKFVKSGSVYKGKKPVHWCPSCITALAEAEVEYNEKLSPSIYVKFEVDKDSLISSFPNLKDKKTYLLIWTTTPWTLPANLALAINPEMLYVAVETNDSYYILAKDNFLKLKEEKILNGEIKFEFLGTKLISIKTIHPFIKRESKVLPADFVTAGEGTGIVHIAPGHGEDDYELGVKYGYEVYAPVDDLGRFTKDVPEFQGQFVFKANANIIERLIKNNSLVYTSNISHSYPHCWRCKKPVIFRATSQWFISMEINDLRKKCLEEINKVTWIPHWGKDRIYNMVLNRPDWCISRQRSWGVPITLIVCQDCETFVNDDDLFRKVIDGVRQEGADFWYTTDIETLLGENFRCSKCGSTTFKKEMDILDVWFDSGVSHGAVLEADERLSWPADLYLEGSDQHRGWFQSSLLASVGTRQRAPYKTVLTHGFTVDGQGKKMSKSLGNVISPQEVIKSSGAEILRIWVSSEDYRDDVRISKEIINRLTEAYRKIRNTCRFLLGNVYDYDGKDYSEDALEIDKWAMSRLQRLILRVDKAYSSFDFHEVFHSIYNFCVVDMSAFYLDIIKDRLYTFRKDSRERRAAQWVLYNILVDMTRLLAPILSFTAEEIWSFIRKVSKTEDKNIESVFLSSFPTLKEKWLSDSLEKKWRKLQQIRDEVNKAMEIKRKDKLIGNSLEAKLTIYTDGDRYDLLNEQKAFLPTLFIVSEVYLNKLSERLNDVYQSSILENLFIKVEHAEGEKCERCWNWSIKVRTFPEYPDICERCYQVLK
ncbi:MAG: isoleucine--tRNA ligase [Thermodesulfovibrionales bacterium]|nr:isoleucine--tRNA ligase [Thermodesulfovibrionales bacterium]